MTTPDLRAALKRLVELDRSSPMHDGQWALKHENAIADAIEALAAEPEPPADGEVAEPPSELLDHWLAHAPNPMDRLSYVAAQAARWGAADLLSRLAPQPVPEGPSYKELMELWASSDWFNEGATLAEFTSISRAVLARWGLAPQTVPKGPTELELEAIELALWDKYRTRGWGGEEFMYDNNFSFALDEYRAVLARWGQT